MASNKLTQTEIKNIQETGPVGLKGIRNKDLYKGQPVDPLRQASNLNKQTKSGSPFYSSESVATPQRTTNFSLGQSVYDDNIAVAPTDSSIQDTRADNQSWVTQLANGIGKGVITAATTFIDGTVGALTGLATMGYRQLLASNDVKQYTSDEIWSGFWDNPITNAMDAITKASEEMMPNYYSTEGETKNFDFGSMNFWADKVIKNFGFTIGAAYSGAVWSKPISALGKAISESNKMKKIFGITKQVLEAAGTEGKVATATLNNQVQGFAGALSGAFGEGSIEALNTKNDFIEKNTAKLDAEYNDRVARIKNQYGNSEQAQYLLAKEKDAYEKTKIKINEDAAAAGNVDLVANLPILTISNFLQFAKMWGGGFRTNSWALNIKRLADGTYDKMGKQAIIKAAIKPIISEGSEEALQQYASDVPTRYYTKDIDNYYKAKTNRKSEIETNSMLKAMTSQLIDTFSDGNTWEQFFIGGLTGALGMPMFGKHEFSYHGGIYNEVKDATELRQRYNHVSDYLNDRIGNKEALQNYYRGLVRNRTYANAMQQAVENGDKKLYLDSEFAQLFSDINMFDEAGRLDDLKEIINATIPQSEEDVNALIELTSSKTLTEQEQQQVDEKNKQAANIKTQIQNLDKQIAEETQNAEAKNEDISNNEKLKDLNKQKEILNQQLSIISNDISTIYKDSKQPWVGPYVDEKGNKKTTEEVKNEVQKQKDKFDKALNSYVKHKAELKQLFNGRFSNLDEENEILGELNFRHAQIDNWNERVSEMSSTLNKKLKEAISNLLLNADTFDSSTLSKFFQERLAIAERELKEAEEGSEEYKGISEEVNKYKELLDKDKGKEKKTKFIEELNELKSKTDEEFTALLRNPNKTSRIASLLLSQENGLEEVDRINTVELYKDTASLNKSIGMYNTKLIEYLTNVSTLQNEHNNIDENNQNEQKNQEKKQLNEDILKASLFDINEHVHNTLNDDYSKYLDDSNISDEVKERLKKARKLQEAINILNKLLQKKVEEGAFPQETADSIKDSVLAAAKKADSVDDILDITSELYQYDPTVANQLSKEDFNNLKEETSKVLFDTSNLLEEGEAANIVHEVAAAERENTGNPDVEEGEINNAKQETDEAINVDNPAITDEDRDNAAKEREAALNAQNHQLDEGEANAASEAQQATNPNLDEDEQKGFKSEQKKSTSPTEKPKPKAKEGSQTKETKGADPVEQPKPISDKGDALNTVGTEFQNAVDYIIKNCLGPQFSLTESKLSPENFQCVKVGNITLGYDFKTKKLFRVIRYYYKNEATNNIERREIFVSLTTENQNNSTLVGAFVKALSQKIESSPKSNAYVKNKADTIFEEERALTYSTKEALDDLEKELKRLLSRQDEQDSSKKDEESPTDTEEDKKDLNERLLNPVKSEEQNEKEITEANEKMEERPSQEKLTSQASQESGDKPITSVYDYWRSGTTEYKMHRERGDDDPYYKVSQNPVHKAIYEFLKKNGVFDRFNNHTYKPKDKVRFAFSKALNKEARTPVLLMIDDNGQIIGDLPNPSDAGFHRYKGLKEFYDKYSNILNEDTSENDLVIIPNVTSSIAKCLIGQPHYLGINDRNSLNDIASTQTSQGTQQNSPKIGVALIDENGNILIRMDGSQKKGARNLEERKVLNPIEVEQGQPFLLIETSDPLRKYYPVPISMRYYQSQSQTTLDKIATELLENLPDASNVLEWKKRFRQIFNVKNVTVNFNKEGKVRNIVILKQGEEKWTFLQNPKDIEKEEIPFNIDYRLLGTKNAFGTNLDYNTIIGEVARTNLGKGEHYTINDWVIINPIIEGQEYKAQSPKGKSKEELLRERADKAQEASNLRDVTPKTHPDFDNNKYKIATIKVGDYNYLYNVDLNKAAIITKKGEIIPVEDRLEKAKNTEDKATEYKIYRTLVNLYITANNINVDNIKTDTFKNRIISTPFGYYNLANHSFVSKQQYDEYLKDLQAIEAKFNSFNYTREDGSLSIDYTQKKDGSQEISNINYEGKNYTLEEFNEQIKDHNIKGQIAFEFVNDVTIGLIDYNSQQGLLDRTFYNTPFGTYSFYNTEGKFDIMDLAKAKAIASLEGSQTSLENNVITELAKEQEDEAKSKENSNQKPTINRESIVETLSKQTGNNPIINSILNELSNDSIALLSKATIVQATSLLKQLKALNRTFKNSEAKDTFIKTKLSQKNSLVTTNNTPTINMEKEVATLIKMLPQLGKDNTIKIVEGLIKTPNGEAYGTFYNGIITLSKQATTDTTFHEGFHYVFNTLYSNKERETLLKKVKKEFGNLSDIELEEKLAENFADFIQTQESIVEDKGIKSFFKQLWDLVMSLFNNKIYIDNAFRNIYKGKYGQRQNINTITVEELAKKATINSYNHNKYAYEKLNEQQKQYIEETKISREEYDNMSAEEKEVFFKCMM